MTSYFPKTAANTFRTGTRTRTEARTATVALQHTHIPVTRVIPTAIPLIALATLILAASEEKTGNVDNEHIENFVLEVKSKQCFIN